MTSSPAAEPSGTAALPEGDALGELIADVETAVEGLGEGIDMTPLDHPHRMLLVHAHPDDEVISTGGTMAESITALLAAGACPEIIVAATHGLLLVGARAKLEHPAVRAVFVTDTVSVTEKDWPRLRIVSIAPLFASALARFLADGSIGDLC